jgi:hypothetical protein
MRVILAGLAVLTLACAATPAAAQSAGWCAIYSGRAMGGSKNCSFRSFEQCQMSVSGIGGFCQPNAFGPQTYPPRRKAKRVRTYRH